MSGEEKANVEKETSGGEGVSKGLLAGIAIAVLAGGVSIAYFLNVVSDQVVGILIAGAFALVLGLMVLKVGLDQAKPAVRYASFALVLGIAFAALYPAKVALHLGHPDASATLSETSRTLKLGSGGDYHVLVSGHLGESRDAKISYRLKAGGTSIIDGALERQYATKRARKGASIQVAEDHDLAAHEVNVPGANPQLVLDQITTGQQVLVQAFSMVSPPIVWVLMALVLLLGTFVETKVPSSGTVVMAAAAAVLFGFIIETADQRSMALGSLWGALLAAGGGAVLGSVLAAIGKKVFKAEPTGPKGKSDKKSGKKEQESVE
ncbi:MAG TPA: hypothetical protein VGK67_25935 [Myxococcales bacterium]